MFLMPMSKLMIFRGADIGWVEVGIQYGRDLVVIWFYVHWKSGQNGCGFHGITSKLKRVDAGHSFNPPLHFQWAEGADPTGFIWK